MDHDQDPHIASCLSCKTVVMRAYRELRERGEDHDSAFRSALHVLNLRHPERSAGDRIAIVTLWLRGEALGRE